MKPRIDAVHPVLMSKDVGAAIQFYERIGFAPAFTDSTDAPKYAGVRRDGVELHLQWHDPVEWEDGHDRPSYRFLVQDVDGLHAEFTANTLGTEMSSVRDTPWGTREFHLRDLDGNVLQFYRDLPAA